MIPIYEMMTKHLHDIHVVCTGSAVDGSILSGGDFDQMFVVQNMIIFEEVDIDDRSKYHFQIERQRSTMLCQTCTEIKV